MRMAPKKAAKGKPGAAPAAQGAAADAFQLFNIYANRQDEVLRPDDSYPQWLWDLDKPSKAYGDLTLMFVHGVGIEDAQLSDYQRFLRQHRKLV
eukprot:CAMPEP_0170631424 /NCGR_PEP_ID=MMETSP0224-20130122/34629_1 /TAXON_ID=285029 /ORGANISM="Togula jolla, Strain CCCM 725" /LENGTH=93 /DNA_ID=CAMNT_0010959753 /DNA_START=33 /DNA_END=311 /DNA_ORIENTATION=-